METSTKSVWSHLDVPLRPLKYGNRDVSSQDKGSTEWAAHSHTPVQLQVWDAFESLVAAEETKPSNMTTKEIPDLQFVMNFLPWTVVKEEEDVTDRLVILLNAVANSDYGLFGNHEFSKATKHILSKPDIIAEERNPEVWGEGEFSDYVSPAKGSKTARRREVAAEAPKLFRFPFETKPPWKFNFLIGRDGNRRIIQNWEVPPDYTSAEMAAHAFLPTDWSSEKKKVFHVVRQLYGQMVSDGLRYGILHFYECWFFCKRDGDGIFYISRGFMSTETNPSVLHCIKTFLGCSDYALSEVMLHPSSATKAPPKKKTKENPPGKPKSSLPPSYGDNNKNQRPTGGGSGGSGSAVASLAGQNVAADIYPWNCDYLDSTDNVQLLTLKQHPYILVKMQRHERQAHVASEMEHEAKIYKALAGNSNVQEVIPRFYGFSTHLGVAVTCVEKELDDFDDIGLENLSDTLKLSAIKCVEAISEAGVLHNDLALRNFVQKKDNPRCARIIDFGRSSFTDDRGRLRAQIQDAMLLLGLNSTVCKPMTP